MAKAPPPPAERKVATRDDSLAALEPAARKLFDTHAQRTPGIGGRYVLHLRVSAGGEILAATVTEKPPGDGADAFAAALAALARTWHVAAGAAT